MSNTSPTEDKPPSVTTTTLPDEPAHEHPRPYAREADRLKTRLDAGEVTLDELGAREYGLLAYWVPSVVTGNGGEPK